MELEKRYSDLEYRLVALEAGARLLARWSCVFTRISSLEQGQCAPVSTSEDQQCRQATEAAVAADQPKPCSVHVPTPGASPTQQRLELELSDRGFSTWRFVRVPADYYDQPLEYRMACVGAASINHLCKSIIFENTRAHPSVDGWKDPLNSKFYVVVVQYTARLHTEKIKSFVHKLSEGKVGKQFYNFRLAPEDVSDSLSGYMHNAVSPVGMATQLPMIISHKILELQPEFFFLGGGEVDLKLGTLASEFSRAYNPFVVDCTYND